MKRLSGGEVGRSRHSRELRRKKFGSRAQKRHPNPFPFTQIRSCLRLLRTTPLLIERLRQHNGIPFTLPSKVISEQGFLLYWNRYHEMLSHTGMFLLFPPINDPSTTSSYFIAQNRSHSARPYRLLSMDFLCTDSEHVSPIAFPSFSSKLCK